jgi:hypothetical protein
MSLIIVIYLIQVLLTKIHITSNYLINKIKDSYGMVMSSMKMNCNNA